MGSPSKAHCGLQDRTSSDIIVIKSCATTNLLSITYYQYMYIYVYWEVVPLLIVKCIWGFIKCREGHHYWIGGVAQALLDPTWNPPA
jgi:hypothetical protein